MAGKNGGGGAGCRAHTTHLVFAVVLALVAANTKDRGGLGADGVDALEARGGRDVAIGVEVLVDGHGGAGAASERVPDRHCERMEGWVDVHQWESNASLFKEERQDRSLPRREARINRDSEMKGKRKGKESQ